MHKGSAEFPETKQFIQERLEQKCLKEIKSVQKVIYFFSLQAQKQRTSTDNIFHCVVLGFKAETFLIEFHLTKYVKRYNLQLNIFIYVLLGFSLTKAFKILY